MNKYQDIVNEIKAAEYIVITSHRSPDGDSIGSSMGLYHFIKKLGKQVVVCHPDPAPEYIRWVEEIDSIQTMIEHSLEVAEHFQKADLIFSLDYNATDRVGPEMQALLEAATCKKIMIDHHLHPQDYCFIIVSETSVCSTSQLICELIIQSGNEELLDQQIGTPLYLGIVTDSGSFRFPSVQSRTHEIAAKLINAGVVHNLVHEQTFDNNSLERLRLQGYALSQKLEIDFDYNFAIISLTATELEQFPHQKGDTEGFVNIALSIKGMKVAVFLAEKDGIVKISFRSKGSVNPVNKLASEHFEGGGHANAAGGKSDLSVQETIDKIKSLIPVYFKK